MKWGNTRKLVLAAVIAAVYTAVNLALGAFGYGAVQVRIAEALAMLCVISPTAICGVSVGCFISNIVGLMLGLNILGVPDIIFGTLATLLAGLLSYLWRGVRFRNVPLLSALPPIIINAAVIGLELTFFFTGQLFNPVFWLHAGSVAAGQLISCAGLGIPLLMVVERTGLDRKLF